MRPIRTVVFQTLWQVIGKGLTSFGTILILGIVTRSYGESGTGLFTLSLVYLSFFYLLADLGINSHLLPHLIGTEGSLVWRRLLGLRIISSAIAASAAIVTLFFWRIDNPFFSQAILFGLVAIFASSFYITATAIFQSKLKYQLAILPTTLGSIVTLAAVYWLSQTPNNPALLVLAHVLGWIICAWVALILVKTYLKNITPLFSLSFIKQTMLAAWPITASLVLNNIYFRLDGFILASYFNLAEVGIYNLAFSIFQNILVVPTFIMNSLYPLMIIDFQTDKKRFWSRFRQSLLIMAGLGVGLLLITYLTAPYLILILTGGQGFIGSTLALQVLGLGLPAFFVSSVLMWMLILIKEYKKMLGIYIAGLVINILLNLWLIPQYSFIAAAGVTSLAEYLILVLQAVILYRHFHTRS